AEAHVVGEAGAELPAAQELEPGEALLLIGPQRSLETGRCRERLDRVLFREPLEYRAEPAPGAHALEVDAGRGVGGAERHAHDLARRHLAAAAVLVELERRVDLLDARLHPVSAHALERLLEPREVLQVAARERLARQADLPVERDRLVEPRLV